MKIYFFYFLGNLSHHFQNNDSSECCFDHLYVSGCDNMLELYFVRYKDRFHVKFLEDLVWQGLRYEVILCHLIFNCSLS